MKSNFNSVSLSELMIKGVVLTFLFLICLSSNAQKAEWLWGQRAGGAGGSGFGADDKATAISTDQHGNVYVCGTIYDSFFASFDTVPVTTYGNNDIFLAKYSCNGELLWVKTGGHGQSGDGASEVIVDTSRNLVYLLGGLGSSSFYPWYWGNDTIITASHRDAFLMQLDTNGNMNWLFVGENTFSGRIGMALDSLGRIRTVITSDSGWFSPSIYLPSPGYYYTTFDQNGNILSMNLLDITGKVNVDAMAVDQNGVLYLGGSIEDTSAVGGQQLINQGLADALLCKFDPQGNLSWVKTEGEAGFYGASILDIDLHDGDIYLTGGFGGGNMTWDGIFLPNSLGGQTPLFAKYKQNGQIVWAKSAKATSAQNGMGVSAGNSQIHFIGYTTGTLTLDGESVTSKGPRDSYIASYKPDGSLVNLNQIGGNGVDMALTIAVGENENLFLAGHFESDLHLANDTIWSKGGNSDIFIAKYGIPECYDTTTVDTTNDTTGVAEYALANYLPLKLYPNPNNGFFTIEIEEGILEGRITVLNSMGQELLRRTTSQSTSSAYKEEIELDVPPGIYFVVLNSAEKNYVQKLVIRK